MVAHSEPVSTDEFEAMARAVERETEGIQLEYIGGRLGFKAVPDGDHDRILYWLLYLLVPFSPEQVLHLNRGLVVGAYRKGRARPDGVVASMDAFVGYGEWGPAEQVSMAVEVTSHDSDTNNRDRIEKPAAYADTKIPIYLLVDRESAEIVVYSQPAEGRYQHVRRYAFGRTVVLPPPVGRELDTTPLLDWVD